jgi:alkylated DNA repair dioxygenase AlkB
MADDPRAGPVTRTVEDGGLLTFHPHFFSPEEADRLFRFLQRNISWKQEHGRFNRPFPRLTALYGDDGLVYKYSGIVYPALPWTEQLRALRQRVEEAAGAVLNSVLLNRYRDGQDSMGYHSDDEPELGLNPVVPSVSLGAERRFVLRHKKLKTRIEYRLTNGSLLIMGGALQHFWEHSLPKTAEPVGERINLTFRNIQDSPGKP